MPQNGVSGPPQLTFSRNVFPYPKSIFSPFFPIISATTVLSGSDPFYLSKKLRRRRYGEVSAQTSQKSQNRALVKKKVAYRAPAAQACTPPTWTINRIFSKSEILAESLNYMEFKKKKNHTIDEAFSLSIESIEKNQSIQSKESESKKR